MRQGKSRTPGICILGAVAAITLAGCISPPQAAGRFTSNMDLGEVADLLRAQAEKCWRRDATVFKNGVLVDLRRPSADTRQVTATRFGRQIGLQKTFMIVDIKRSATGVSVEVAEGEYECEIGLGCYKMDFAPDVPRWLAGDLSCKVK